MIALPKQGHDAFKGISLIAKAAYVYDVNAKKVLFEKNGNIPLPLASLTKAVAALMVAESNGSKTRSVTIGANDLGEEGDSGLQEGEKWKLKDLLSFTLMVSSNDGARSLANVYSLFLKESGKNKANTLVDAMNQKADFLNLKTLSFNNPTGLDAGDGSLIGGEGSAEDIALLFDYATKHHPDIYEATKYPELNFSSDILVHQAINTNVITGKIPNIVAGKTGYTELAGGNLIVEFDKGLNEPIIMVVLGSTFDGRFSDMLLLASSTMQTYNTLQ